MEHREQESVSSAAAAAKSPQSCPTLCNPIDGSPPGSPSLGFVRQEHWSGSPFPSPVHASEKGKGSRSVVSDSSRPHGLQPLSMGFSRQEYWSGLPLNSSHASLLNILLVLLFKCALFMLGMKIFNFVNQENMLNVTSVSGQLMEKIINFPINMLL